MRGHNACLYGEIGKISNLFLLPLLVCSTVVDHAGLFIKFQISKTDKLQLLMKMSIEDNFQTIFLISE